ncbi:MAG: glycogen debranching protein GlgX [Candidatus Thermoplasmatota archaeon]|nr:glycogen debranching protein GlgX [Candidatus Thermoplasmatota archaeon]MCL5790985.1 glycogen debranching protein GlgX [Candidatus Thermoplasmatota archaeon]
MIKVRAGSPYPLGPTLTDEGVNFSVYSENAGGIYLDLFSSPDQNEPSETIELKEKDSYVWHIEVPGIRPGQLYAYRARGTYNPSEGLFFNEHKTLIDPYARALDSTLKWDNSVFPYDVEGSKVMKIDERDDCRFVPKGIVTDGTFDWQGIRKPERQWNRTIIYETHVKGVTFKNESIPVDERGTYAGLSRDSMLDYFTDLGITSVELMPVHHHVDDRILVEHGLTNYWGYNTIAYFAPDIRYSRGKPGEQVREFKEMVRAFHSRGIEIILDVVYNHTAEGNHLGPSLSFRGLDNRTYYILDPVDKSSFIDFTGVGNSLNSSHPQVLQLIMDSLRYWATDMQVDGFRFDLASTMARSLYSVNMLSPFMATIHQDPVLSKTKLIAEPWDIGPGGYQVGNFPPKWAEWNGKYRDSMRRFWRFDRGLLGEFATRISGSPDLYEASNKRPHSSINFITCHDGFTMMDLVSYSGSHNEANGPLFMEGAGENFSDNLGIEGHTDDPFIKGLRYRRIKNMLLTLIVSQGTPMILGGDEIGRTQDGNNNAFCQDNEISWYNWNIGHEEKNLRKFLKHIIALRRSNPVLARKNFFMGSMVTGTSLKDVTWLTPECQEMGIEQWNEPQRSTLMVWLNGRSTEEIEYEDMPITGGDLLILFNSSRNEIMFTLPDHGKKWELYADTNLPDVENLPFSLNGNRYLMMPNSSAIIRERTA